MAAWLDGVNFTPTLGGTTDWVVSAAVIGYNTPALGGAVNATKYKYHAQSADQSQWEDGEGSYTVSTTTLTRTTVLYNSSGTGTGAGQSGAGTKINFSTAPTVSVVALKEDMISVEEDNNFTAAQKSQLRRNMDLMRFNYIMNGAMMISQENGATAGTVTAYRPADCWECEIANAGAWTLAQVASATPGGSPNRIRFTVTAADASVGVSDLADILQKVEGLRTTDLKVGTANAKTITIQFGVKAPAGTYCVVVMNGSANRSYVAEYVISGGEANTDVVKSVTVPLDQSGTWSTTNTIGMFVRWGLMAGSTFQQAAGSWSTGNVIGSSNQFNIMGTNGNVFELFDVGMYEGTVAPAFKVPDPLTELFLCFRYYLKLAYNAVTVCMMQNYSSTLAIGGVVYFPTTMRVTPTLSVSAAGDFALLPAGAGNIVATSVSSRAMTQNNVDLGVGVAAGLTPGAAISFLGQNANARIVFDARL